MPHLLTYAKKTDISVHEAFHNEFLEDLFHLPLSQQAFIEFEQLEDICQQTMQSEQSNLDDEWSYVWGNNAFSSMKAYKVMIGHQPTPPHFSWTWNSSCQAKHKFFFWLLLLDRLNTRNLLGREKFQVPSFNCATLNCPMRKH